MKSGSARGGGGCPSGRGSVARINERRIRCAWLSSSAGVSPSGASQRRRARRGLAADGAVRDASGGDSEGSAETGSGVRAGSVATAAGDGGRGVGPFRSSSTWVNRRRLLFAPLRRHLALFVFVLCVTDVATRLFDLIVDHRDDGVIGDTALAWTIIVQHVAGPIPAVLHALPRKTDSAPAKPHRYWLSTAASPQLGETSLLTVVHGP